MPLLRRALGLWLLARPMQLLAVALVYAWGALLAHHQGAVLTPAGHVAALLALLLVAASIHYANEYADQETDALTTRTPFSGGSGAIPRGLARAQDARRGMVILLIFGLTLALLAAVLGLAGDLRSLAALGIGAGLGWGYSLPPLKLAWRGWGELDNALLGGLLLPLYGFFAAGAPWHGPTVGLFLPFTVLVFLNLLATTWPDRSADSIAGKRTLAVRWPVPRLRRLYTLGVLGFALLALAVMATPGIWLVPLVLAGAWAYTRLEAPHVSVGTMVLYLLLALADPLLASL